MQLRHTLKLAFAAIIGIATLSSCELDDNWNDDLEKTPYIAVGTVKKTDGKFYILEDDSNRIFTRNYQNFSDTMIGKRVWIKFYNYKKELKDPAFAQTAYIFELGRKLLTKPVVKIETVEQNDSIGNDPINIRSMWVTGKYLNVEFIYAGSYGHTHYINLAQSFIVKALDGVTSVCLEFRHNANKDIHKDYYQGVASFDLTGFYPADGYPLSISYKPYNSSEMRSIDFEMPKLTEMN